VLDLGCGKGLSRIFLAKEYEVQVWAADLWIKPTDNHERIRQAGVEDRVCPFHADARSLPFAEGYFDAIICTDAYNYFGTDDLYLDYLHQFVKPGSQIGILPGLCVNWLAIFPTHPSILGFECWTGTIDWCIGRFGLVDDISVEVLPDGWKLWLQWKSPRKGGRRKSFTDINIQVWKPTRPIWFYWMAA
jgi:SAM-dependent methyltransferase